MIWRCKIQAKSVGKGGDKMKVKKLVKPVKKATVSIGKVIAFAEHWPSIGSLNF